MVVNGDELTNLVMNTLRLSSGPLSPEEIAKAVLQFKPDIVPQQIYNPSETYREGQRLYHCSPTCEGWFVILESKKSRIRVQFDDDRCMTLGHESQQRFTFPTTPVSFLTEMIGELLPTLAGLYQEENLWFDRPIHKESIEVNAIESPSTLIANANPVIHSETIEAVLRRYKIQYFYHITHFDNLPGVLKRGLWCRNKIKIFPDISEKFRDISDDEIQNVRHRKCIPQYPDLTLHDCVPLFVAPKPPMLGAHRNIQSEIVYIKVHPTVLYLSRVVFTDGNARSDSTKFFDRPDDFNLLDWRILWAESLWSDDPEVYGENKRRRSAEVLVPRWVPPSYTKAVAVINADTQRRALKVVQDMQEEVSVLIEPSMYYPITDRVCW